VFCTTALNDWDLDVTDVSVLAGHANTQITMERYVSNTAGTLSRAFLLTASAPSRPEPSQPAGPDRAADSQPGSRTVLAPGRPVEIERTVGDDGRVAVADEHADVGKRWAGRTVVLRLDGHRMHGILDSALIGTWPCPVPATALAGLDGAVPASVTLPSPLPTIGNIRAERKVSSVGRFQIHGELVNIGWKHAGKRVTVHVEGDCFRVLYDGEEIAVKPRASADPQPFVRRGNHSAESAKA
jgi:hypothetical protein